jgi:hypothetical protein
VGLNLRLPSLLGINVNNVTLQTSQVMGYWYQQFEQHEGQNIDYSVVNTSSMNEAQAAQTFQQSFNQLNASLTDLLGSLPNCLKAN